MDQSTSSQESKKKNHKIITVILWVGMLLLIGIVILALYLFATKQLVLAVGSSPDKGIAVQTRACGKATIKKYNDVYTTDSIGNYNLGLKTAFDATTSENGFKSDPNCVYIRYSYYISQKDTANAQKELDGLKILAGNGSYATSEVVGVQSIETMQAAIDILKNPTQTQPTSGQSSGGQG